MKTEIAYRKLGRALKTLSAGQGRIARRNARRRTFGALRSLSMAIEAEYPTIKKPKPEILEDGVARAARKMHYKEFEHLFIKHVRRDWDVEMAQGFIDFVAKRKLTKGRELVVLDISSRYIGFCGSETIEIEDRMSSENKWRVLIHEVTHMIDSRSMHGPKFVLSMAEVYRMWRDFLKTKTRAAKRETS